MVSGWNALSSVIGWLYILAWSFSFYPQVILNYRRKSVTGFSLDFAHLNVLGFLAYTTYTLAFLCSMTIQDEYRHQAGESEPLVRINDAVFAGHALLLSSVTLSQAYLPGYERAPAQTVSTGAKVFMLTSAATIGIMAALALQHKCAWIEVIYILGYVKLLVSFLKYIPQLILNFRTKSLKGWSMLNILLDFTGGLLSLVQLLLDCTIAHDFSAITGNFAKTGLALLSLLFDMAFAFQHFVLYREKDIVSQGGSTATEDQRLLSGPEVSA